ncbi:type II toxin-antitoxin system RelE/ParE family toxin [Ectothiorhodospiraceae bacterium WFHF3C12]|nr:type II toxin-antitoxin system RelE/ParE family toxin [Ectothiorhodospiraceae bacterium WFHF3C12]
MTYELSFKESALKEWKKLDPPIQDQFRKKLKERRDNPHVPGDRLREKGFEDCYKIKLRASGFRLVYQVRDGELVIVVVAIGKRERGAVYSKAKDRL